MKTLSLIYGTAQKTNDWSDQPYSKIGMLSCKDSESEDDWTMFLVMVTSTQFPFI